MVPPGVRPERLKESAPAKALEMPLRMEALRVSPERVVTERVPSGDEADKETPESRRPSGVMRAP